MVDSLILLDARREVGVIGGVTRVSPDCSSQFPVLSSQLDPKLSNLGVSGGFKEGGVRPRQSGLRSKRKKLEPQGARGYTGNPRGVVLVLSR